MTLDNKDNKEIYTREKYMKELQAILDELEGKNQPVEDPVPDVAEVLSSEQTPVDEESITEPIAETPVSAETAPGTLSVISYSPGVTKASAVFLPSSLNSIFSSVVSANTFVGTSIAAAKSNAENRFIIPFIITLHSLVFLL